MDAPAGMHDCLLDEDQTDVLDLDDDDRPPLYRQSMNAVDLPNDPPVSHELAEQHALPTSSCTNFRYLPKHIETATYTGLVTFGDMQTNKSADICDALCLHLLKVMARLRLETCDIKRNLEKRMNKNEVRIYRGLMRQLSSRCGQYYGSYQELFQRARIRFHELHSAVYFKSFDPTVAFTTAGKARFDHHAKPSKTKPQKNKVDSAGAEDQSSLPSIAALELLQKHCDRISMELDRVEENCRSAGATQVTPNAPMLTMETPVVWPFATNVRETALKNSRATSYPQFFENVQVFQHYDEILSSVEANAVTIFRAATGSGKSTGVPIILLDALAKKGAGSNRGRILCIQPRRLAATSIASYIKSIRQAEAGRSDVGSIVRFDYNAQLDADVLIYMTTGIFLRMLMGQESFENVSHIIIDEIHERSLEIDIILLLLREKFLQAATGTSRSFPKLLLMSATFDCEKFEKYFKSYGISINSLLISVKKRFSVDVIPLEGVLQKTAHIGANFLGFPHPSFGIKHKFLRPKGSRLRTHEQEVRAEHKIQPPSRRHLMETLQVPWHIAEQLHASHEKALSGDYELNYELIIKTILSIDHENKQDNGTVLVFLPTMASIKTVEQALIELQQESVLKIIKLHSKLEKSSSEIYEPAPTGMRKVILSTNIAQTSLTIPDVVYIVDTGVQHMRIIERGADIPYRCDGRISQACATQRAGRAGRVANGVVYQLYSAWEKANLMEEFLVPEILRTLHEHICLLMVSGGWVKDPQALLQKAIDPPPARRVVRALALLQELHAIDTMADGVTYRATNVGCMMSKLDLEPRAAKMVVLSKAFGILPIGLFTAPLLEIEQFVSYSVSSEQRDERLKSACMDAKNDFLAMAKIFMSAISNSYQIFRWCTMNDLLTMEIESALANYKRLLGTAEHCFKQHAGSIDCVQSASMTTLPLRFFAILSGAFTSTVMDRNIKRTTSAIVTRHHGETYDVTIARPSAVTMPDISYAVKHSGMPVPVVFHRCYQRKTLSRKIQTVGIGDFFNHLLMCPTVQVDTAAPKIAFNEGLAEYTCKREMAVVIRRLRSLLAKYIELCVGLPSHTIEFAQKAVCALIDDTHIRRISYNAHKDYFGIDRGQHY